MGLVVLWLILILSTAPIHLALPAITGYASLVDYPKAVAIDVNDFQRYGRIRMDVYMGLDRSNRRYTEYFRVTLEAPGWKMLFGDDCRKLFSNKRRNENQTIMNGIVVIAARQDHSWYTYLDLTPWTQPFEHYEAILNSTMYCFVNSAPTVCQLTFHWTPAVIVATALLVKSVAVVLGLGFLPHFRYRSFNCLGDMLSLSVRHPELAAHLPSNIGLEIQGKKMAAWRQCLGTIDYAIIAFWWACRIHLSVLGVGDTWAKGTKFFDPSSRTGQGGLLQATFVTAGLIANAPQIWVSIAYFVWNYQITRIWMEREWHSYYLRPQRPRVSYDTEDEAVQSTGWPQLPFLHSLVLTILGIILHWIMTHGLVVVEYIGGNPGDHRTSYEFQIAPAAAIVMGLIVTFLVLLITIFYFKPTSSRMPALSGSLQVVLYFSKHLGPNLPKDGIAWADLSTGSEFRAGFGRSVKPLRRDVVYPWQNQAHETPTDNGIRKVTSFPLSRWLRV